MARQKSADDAAMAAQQGALEHRAGPAVRMVLVALGSGLVAGFLLGLLAFVVARYGFQGDGWSLRGNGALIVPFGLGPSLLTGGWTALVLHARLHPRWLRLGTAAGVFSACLVGANVGLLALGPAAAEVSQALLLANLVLIILAPLVAGFARRRSRVSASSWATHILAAVAYAAGIVGGLGAENRLLPPGS